MHLVKPELLVNVWAGFFTIILNVGFGIVSILMVKEKLGGRIVFKDAFSAYFITILIASFMATVFLLLQYYVIISPENLSILKQNYIEFNIKMIQQNFAQTEDIDEIIEFYKSFNPFSFSEVIMAALKFLLRDCLIGFLVALIFRNQKSV